MFVVTQKIPQKFTIIDQLNNTNSLLSYEINHLLLQKEKFWIPVLLTIHKGLNSTHEWNRKRRTERPKQLMIINSILQLLPDFCPF